MMGYFEWITLLLQIVPLVMQVIQQVELPGNGPEKRAMVIALVLEALNSSLTLAGKQPLTEQQIQSLSFFIGLVADRFVGFFNKTGIFKKTVVVQPQ